MKNKIYYEVLVGDELIACEETIERAKEEFDKLPDGNNKRPGLRRLLNKVEVILEDARI